MSYIRAFEANIFTMLSSTCFLCVNLELKYSASEEIFRKANRFEKKWSKIINFVIFKLTPAFALLPWCIYVYFLYFTTDLGTDAFELPYPMW